MSDIPVWQLSAVETARRIHAGNLSAVEAVSAALDRLDQCNEAINAVTMPLHEHALGAASAADSARAKGETLGPLHGVPVTIKENVDQQGLPNTNGLPAFAQSSAPGNAPVVANLLAAGAIIIGRTNTPEFSYRWFTDNPLRGRTLNPWDAGITPGGSSGGAAAAVAMGIGAIAHGNDLGGSLRYPAYACGLATIKPSLGRVASYNPSAPEERPPSLQLMSVQGPIARCVADVRVALAAMARPDARDPWWVPAPLAGPALERPLRVALTRGPVDLECDPKVLSALMTAADHLRAAGYVVEEVDPPNIDEAAERWRQLLGADTQEMMLPAIRQFGSERINDLADVLADLSAANDLATYMRLSADRTRLWREWAIFMQSYPLVLAPVSQAPPFPQGADELGTSAYQTLVAQQSMLYAVNLLGLPSAAIPTGLNQGVPMGVQLIGQRFREDVCLDAAQVIEDAVGVLAQTLWART
jgi:amidase